MSLEIQIETISTCSAKCHFCIYPQVAPERAGVTMKMDIFRKIVDEAITIPIIDRIVLHGLGEPTLDKHLADRMSYIRARSNITIEIYSHGAHLTPQKFDALKAAGLTSLVFSLNAVNQEQHQRIMGLVGKFDTVCSNIEYAIANRDHVGIEIHSVINGDYFTAADGDEFRARWGDYGRCIYENNWAGENRNMRTFDPNSACSRALGQIYVMVDGRVSMCCLDPTGKTIFGDFKEQGLREIYNSEFYTLFRELHSSDKAAVFKQCKVCTRT